MQRPLRRENGGEKLLMIKNIRSFSTLQLNTVSIVSKVTIPTSSPRLVAGEFRFRRRGPSAPPAAKCPGRPDCAALRRPPQHTGHASNASTLGQGRSTSPACGGPPPVGALGSGRSPDGTARRIIRCSSVRRFGGHLPSRRAPGS